VELTKYLEKVLSSSFNLMEDEVKQAIHTENEGDYYFTNKLYPLCIAVGPESIFILDKCGFYRGQYSSTYRY